MAFSAAIVGESGTGKSTSIFNIPELGIQGLPPEETIIINPAAKPLIVKGANKLYPIGKLSDGGRNIHERKAAKIAKIISLVDTDPKYSYIKYIVVEDAQYLQAFVFMNKIQEKSYDKFNDTGEAAWLPLKAMVESVRTDLFIFFIYHLERINDSDVKIKTSGKAVDNYLTVEGLFSIVLYTHREFDPVTKTGKYSFTTQNNGFNTAKSPPGMFSDYYIPNDLGFVAKKMQEFYCE